eukprot:CAMPEP_0114553980 /NCGR_PEP_ID=MMETSP0114-20121206/7963_1 /TAXON_ID=31324 /ORGANISM="Goniomonas sp, Strain m" /LENGTH=283 /DNA_ID=CAMNT_0001738991 /DNA_START=20 /DNA_END=868 /DNA_ORIENTATION=+
MQAPQGYAQPAPQGYAQPAPVYQQYAPQYQQYAPQMQHYPPRQPADAASMLRFRCRADAITAIVFACLCLLTCWGSFYLPISGIAGILAMVAGPLCLANLSRHKTYPRSGLYHARNLYIAVAVCSGIAVVGDTVWFGFFGWNGFSSGQQPYLSCTGESSSYSDSCSFNNYVQRSSQYCYNTPPSCYLYGYNEYQDGLAPFSITAFVNLLLSVGLLAASITGASHASMLVALLRSPPAGMNPLYQPQPQPQPQPQQQMVYPAGQEAYPAAQEAQPPLPNKKDMQ